MSNTFITYQQAVDILDQHKASFPVAKVPIADCDGLVLAEDLIADRDFPPYHRVTMDGIAIRHRTFDDGMDTFPIQEVAPAGSPQKTLLDVNNCIEVMTGAILPSKTDTVIRYEDLNIQDGQAQITIETITKRQNIHFKGIDIAQGTVVKKEGQRISSAEVNVAAATGMDTIAVREMPSVVIVSTGDELVDVNETPADYQIRRASGYGIRNTLKEWGIQATLKHLPDNEAEMEEHLTQLLNDFDVLVITGGVSKGKYDFLPGVLTRLGVVKHFHKIQQRPGKPLWFGTRNDDTYVFGLPGNPVSSFVCLYVYVRYWLMQSLHIEDTPLYVTLAEDVTFKPDLIYFTEAKLHCDTSGTLWAEPIFGNGSGDFVNLVYTDGFLILPQEKQHFKKGEVYPFLPYRINW